MSQQEYLGLPKMSTILEEVPAQPPGVSKPPPRANGEGKYAAPPITKSRPQTLLAIPVGACIALAIHFFTWYVRISDSTKISYIQAGFYFGALTGVVLWLWQARRPWHPRALMGR